MITQDGLARSIGVSSFPPAQIEWLLAETGTVPAVNQVELHPWLPQAVVREFGVRHGIVTQAWSPLAHGQLVDDPAVATVAQRHGKTPAQVLLRWNLDLGNVVVSKSVTSERIPSDLQVFDFALTEEDHDLLSSLDCGRRTGPDPDVYER